MILDDVKIRLRLSSTAFDADVTDLMDEAKADLARAGILTIMDTDPAIARAIKLYCKAYFDLNNPDLERWVKAYESQRDSLALDGDYNGMGA